jgi:hypothetical protein
VLGLTVVAWSRRRRRGFAPRATTTVTTHLVKAS